MLRITHKLTAISSPTPLLLNARDSSNIMPAYPIPNNNAMAASWIIILKRLSIISILENVENKWETSKAPDLLPPKNDLSLVRLFQQLQKLQELSANLSWVGYWI